MSITAIALFSGGLDSILSCKVIARQGIKVMAVKFISPFFDYGLLAREAEYCEKIKEKYEIDIVLRDISDEYIEMVRNPEHGHGKHFNPCLDCKIFMMKKAREMMPEFNASFLFSGEVVGQRPMSQRRDALRVVERDSGCEDILLRPLCAKRLDPTPMEVKGLVDREGLGDLSGRSRAGQIAMAKQFGVNDYPTPAGGCILTDPMVGERIKSFYAEHSKVTVEDMQLIQVGRQFKLPGGSWLVMGRKMSENLIIEKLIKESDIKLKLLDRPGPTALLRYLACQEDLETAAGLVARYAKKGEDGMPASGQVSCESQELNEVIAAIPAAESVSKKLLI